MNKFINREQDVMQLQNIFILDSVFANQLDNLYTIESSVEHKTFPHSEIDSLHKSGFKIRSITYHTSRLYMTVERIN